jgi:hypothetical protein
MKSILYVMNYFFYKHLFFRNSIELGSSFAQSVGLYRTDTDQN